MPKLKKFFEICAEVHPCRSSATRTETVISTFKVGVKRGKAGHLGLFLRVTFSFLHHEKSNATENKHPPMTDKRNKQVDWIVCQFVTHNIITMMFLARGFRICPPPPVWLYK